MPLGQRFCYGKATFCIDIPICSGYIRLDFWGFDLVANNIIAILFHHFLWNIDSLNADR